MIGQVNKYLIELQQTICSEIKLLDGGALFAGANTDTSVTISTTAARYTVARTIPADSKGFSVEFALGAHVNTDGLEITGIQVELGTVTEFEHRSFGEELALCQRYFTKSFPYGTAPANNAGVTNTIIGESQAASGPAYAHVYFKQTMRAAPSISHFNPSANNGSWRNTTANSDINVAVGSIGDATMFIGSNTQVMNQYAICQIHYSASAEL